MILKSVCVQIIMGKKALWIRELRVVVMTTDKMGWSQLVIRHVVLINMSSVHGIETWKKCFENIK